MIVNDLARAVEVDKGGRSMMLKQGMSPRQRLVARIKALETGQAEARNCAYLGGKSKTILRDFARRIQEARKDLKLLAIFRPSRASDPLSKR